MLLETKNSSLVHFIVGSPLSGIGRFLTSVCVAVRCLFVRCITSDSKEIARNEAEEFNLVRRITPCCGHIRHKNHKNQQVSFDSESYSTVYKTSSIIGEGEHNKSVDSGMTLCCQPQFYLINIFPSPFSWPKKPTSVHGVMLL